MNALQSIRALSCASDVPGDANQGYVTRPIATTTPTTASATSSSDATDSSDSNMSMANESSDSTDPNAADPTIADDADILDLTYFEITPIGALVELNRH